MGHPPAYTYGGVPYEAREAKGKGKDGETYYTVKAVTGRKPGSKEYELKDHLGNVRVVISDIKHSVIASGVVGSFNADVKVMRDYYAFGMEMPGQIWQAGGYRYGFQGQEKDDEVQGQGNSYAFEYRMHDARVGRFWSIDPLAPDYPWNSPYAFSENSTIAFVELEGLERFYAADGSLLGGIGSNTEIRVVTCEENVGQVRDLIALANIGSHLFSGSAFLIANLMSETVEDYAVNTNDVLRDAPLETYWDNDKNCYSAAIAQMGNAGISTVEKKYAIQTDVDNVLQAEKKGELLSENKVGGVVYIISQLREGKPVMVGVKEATQMGFADPGNYNSQTGHFAVIASISSVDCTMEFGDDDNASSESARGIDFVKAPKAAAWLTKPIFVQKMHAPMKSPKSGKTKNKAMGIVILTFLFLAQFACNPSTNAPKVMGGKDMPLPVPTVDNAQCWVNSEYQACMAQRLPCDCRDIQEPHLLYLDPGGNTVETYGVESGEGYLKPLEPASYTVYFSKSSPTPYFSLRINHDTLLLKGDGFTPVPFLPLGNSPMIGDHKDKLARYNYLVIKERVEKAGTSFSEFTQLDTAEGRFTCNGDLGLLNLLYQRGRCEKDMIAVEGGHQITFYHLLNSCQDKDALFSPDTARAFSIQQ